MRYRHSRLLLVVVLATTLLAATPASAQEFRSGGTITVPEGTVHDGDLSAVGGTVIVDGTVDGSIEGAVGSIVVTGTVTGDVKATAGSVTISGVVEGDVETAAGSVTVDEGGRVGGALEAGAGSVTIEGRVDGDVEAGAETLTVGESARIGGDLTYAAETVTIADGATVDGTTERVDSLNVGVHLPLVGEVGGFLPAGVFAIFGFFANLLLGVIVLLAAPRFAERVAETGTNDPVKTGAAGVLALLGIPIALVVLAFTVVGIPLTIAGFLSFLLVLWVSFVYGALVVGTWLLSLAEYETPWVALVVGLAIPPVVSMIPLGGFVTLIYLLVGLGAFALSALALRRREGPTTGAEDEAPDGPHPA